MPTHTHNPSAGTPPAPSYIHYYPERLGHGRAILRVDVVVEGELVESHTSGSPAPYETVAAAERRTELLGVSTAAPEVTEAQLAAAFLAARAFGVVLGDDVLTAVIVAARGAS
jgi:hypothetical protein